MLLQRTDDRVEERKRGGNGSERGIRKNIPHPAVVAFAIPLKSWQHQPAFYQREGRIMMKIHLRDLEQVEHLTKLLLVFAPGQRSPPARGNTVQLCHPLIPK